MVSSPKIPLLIHPLLCTFAAIALAGASSAETFNCNSPSSCQSIVLTCSTSPCVLNCTAASACESLVFTCNPGGDCAVTCDAQSACRFLTLDGTNAAPLGGAGPD